MNLLSFFQVSTFTILSFFRNIENGYYVIFRNNAIQGETDRGVVALFLELTIVHIIHLRYRNITM